jgi:uncharacterized integral membrane protein
MELFGAPLIVLLGAFIVGALFGTWLAKADIFRGKTKK